MPQRRTAGWWKSLCILVGFGGVCSIVRGVVYSPIFGPPPGLAPGLQLIAPVLFIWWVAWFVGGIAVIVTAATGFRRLFWPAFLLTLAPLILWVASYLIGWLQASGDKYTATVTALGFITYSQVLSWLLALLIALNIIRKLLLHVGERR